MKKGTLKWIVCTVIMALTLSVTACSGSEDAVTADTTEVEEIAETEVEEEPEVVEEPETEPEAEEELQEEPETQPEVEEEPEAEEKGETASEAKSDSNSENAEEETEEAEDEYLTLEEYCNEPENKEGLEAAYAAMSEEGITVSIEVKGNVFTVIIKIEDRSRIKDGIGEKLAAGMDEQIDRLKASVKQFDDLIGQEGACTVIMRYTDPDDNILAEKAITAN